MWKTKCCWMTLERNAWGIMLWQLTSLTVTVMLGSWNNQTLEKCFSGGTLWMSVFHALIMMLYVFDCVNKEDLPWGVSGSLAGGIRILDRVKQCIKSFHTDDPLKNETSEHLLHSMIHLRHQITYVLSLWLQSY